MPYAIYKKVLYTFGRGEWEACLKGPAMDGHGYAPVESQVLRQKLSAALETELRGLRSEAGKFQGAARKLQRILESIREILPENTGAQATQPD